MFSDGLFPEGGFIAALVQKVDNPAPNAYNQRLTSTLSFLYAGIICRNIPLHRHNRFPIISDGLFARLRLTHTYIKLKNMHVSELQTQHIS
ncbi:MAG TPA: hypothetical protein PLK27_07770, partial [Neisseria sp.]|nr:hypothetical protein [Neisseria sp.]